jgi:hypothetical protein
MKTTTTTLLDAVLPEFDFSSRHTRCVAATPERVAEAVNGVRLGGAASLLVKIRGLHIPSGPIWDALAGSGFTVLAERPGVELVAGTTGRFWALREQAHIEAPSISRRSGPSIARGGRRARCHSASNPSRMVRPS